VLAGCPRCWWLSSGVFPTVTAESPVLLYPHLSTLWAYTGLSPYSATPLGVSGPLTAAGAGSLCRARPSAPSTPPPLASTLDRQAAYLLWGVWGAYPLQKPSRGLRHTRLSPSRNTPTLHLSRHTPLSPSTRRLTLHLSRHTPLSLVLSRWTLHLSRLLPPPLLLAPGTAHSTLGLSRHSHWPPIR